MSVYLVGFAIGWALGDAVRAHQWFTVVLLTAAAVANTASASPLAGPPACPPDVLSAACEAQAACVARVYVTRTASTGVATREAALVARLAAEHACALEAWGYAKQRAAAVAVATSSAACPPCLTANPPASSESCPGDRPTWIDALSHGGACALCGGGVALGAWAACGGAR